MGVRDIDDIVEQDIINKMDVSVKITSATLINDSYKITLCNQKYARIMSKLFQETIDVNGDAVTVEWEIALDSFDEDGSFLVTNSDPFYTLKSGDVLRLPLPHYFRGTPLAVNGEWRAFSPFEWDKLPMVWLAQPTDEEWHSDENVLERTADITLFFLASANFRDDFTKDLRVKQVVPLMSMANLAIDHVKNAPAFGKGLSYNTRDFSKFGRETEKGIERNIIDSDLSAVRLRMSLPIYKNNSCDC